VTARRVAIPRRWRSREGRQLLARLLAGDAAATAMLEGQLRHWQWTLINRAAVRLARVRRRDPAERARAAVVLALADELDVFLRGEEPTDEMLDRLEARGFRGRRSHLVRLLAFLHRENLWSRWRATSRQIPDLRGADLGQLDLRHVDLRRARLRGAQLGGAQLRTCDLRHADLRQAGLRHTDFSYADMRWAKLGRANLTETLLSGADLRCANLRGAFLIGASMNQAKLQGANLSGAVVWGVNAWDVEEDAFTRQKPLHVAEVEPLDFYQGENTRVPWYAVRVNDLKVAHFVSLLLKYPEIGKLINAAADKVVLLLGRFIGRERRVLDVLLEALPRFGLVPVVFDFEQPEDRDTIETVAILAGLSSFVIANLSKPRSTPLEAHLVIPAIAVPFVPIIRKGERPFSMFTALQRKYPWVLPTVTYHSEKSLIRNLRRSVIQPATKLAKEIRRLKHPRAASSG
jgi:uncharacterized protein YjbI with pentapeptide repeats